MVNSLAFYRSHATQSICRQFYLFGVFESPLCSETSLDHAIVLEGWDHEVDDFGQEIEFWWVRNSWGADWGYSGRIKLYKGNNMCGVRNCVMSIQVPPKK